MKEFFIQSRRVLKPLFGVLASQILVMMINTTDLIYVGKFGSDKLAALAVAYGCFVPIVLLLAGFVRISPIIAHSHGKHSDAEISHLMRHDMFLTFLLGLLGGIIVYFFSYRIGLIFSVSSDILALSQSYLKVIAFGMPAFLFYFAFRSLFEGFLRTRFILYGGIVAFIIDLSLNYLNHTYQLFGYLGVGLAHIISYYGWFATFLVVYYFDDLKKFKIFDISKFHFDIKHIQKIFHYSFYVGVGSLIESLFFTSTSLMVAKFGSTPMASYKLVLNTATIIVMIPATLGVVISSMIGYNLGARKFDEIKKTITTSFFLFAIFFVFCIFVFTSFKREIMDFYSDDEQIITIAEALLLFMLVNFLFQSIDTLTGAIIKGFNRTKYIWRTTLVCYWLIGLPLMYVLSSTNWLVPAMNVRGIFLGMLTAYGIGTIAFSYFSYKCYKEALN